MEHLKKKHKRYRQILLSVFAAAICILMYAPSSGAADYPKHSGAINDFAGVIEPQDKTAMENLAREVLEKTGTAVVVATVETIGDSDASQYANELYAAWGIGKKGEDKGVLILLAIKERKVQIETGYGVEGILPDGLTGEILDRYALPQFKAGDYSKGLQNTVIAVSSVIAKDAGISLTGAPSLNRQRVRKPDGPKSILPTVLFILALGFLLGTRQGRAMLPYILLMLMSGSGRRGGGGFDGFGGGFGGFGGGMSGGGGAGRSF